jgi:predicted DNA-binding antitoxin AbrB/MazE fold protein
MEMSRNIEVIYEDGVLKPLSPLNLKEHEKVKITLEEGESIIRATSGMFSGLDDNTIEEIALSPEFLPEEA